MGTIWARIEAMTDMFLTDISVCRRRSGRSLRRVGGLDRRCDQGVVDRRRIAVGRGAIVGDPRQLFARLLGLALAVPHAGIEPALGEQLMMAAALDDGALVEHE